MPKTEKKQKLIKMGSIQLTDASIGLCVTLKVNKIIRRYYDELPLPSEARLTLLRLQ